MNQPTRPPRPEPSTLALMMYNQDYDESYSIPGKNLSGGRNLLPNPPHHGADDYNTIGFLDGHVQDVSQKNLSDLLWIPHLATIPMAPDPQHSATSSHSAPTGK